MLIFLPIYGVVEFLDCVQSSVCTAIFEHNDSGMVANSAEGAFPVGRKSTKTKPGSATHDINNLALKCIIGGVFLTENK